MRWGRKKGRSLQPGLTHSRWWTRPLRGVSGTSSAIYASREDVITSLRHLRHSAPSSPRRLLEDSREGEPPSPARFLLTASFEESLSLLEARRAHRRQSLYPGDFACRPKDMRRVGRRERNGEKEGKRL